MDKVEPPLDLMRPVAQLDTLQVLRGLAAFAVVLFHLLPHLEAVFPKSGHLLEPLRFGFVGVDIFFVLSGFVVALTALQTRMRPGPFLLRRFVRIYSGYLPALALVLTVGWFFLDQRYAEKNFLSSLLLIETSHQKSLLPTAWSLPYELYFYALIAAVIFWASTLRAGFVTLISLIVLWNIAMWLLARNQVYAGTQFLRFFFSAFAIEFFAGAILCHVWLFSGRGFARMSVQMVLVVCVLAVLVGSTSPLFTNIELFRVATFGWVGVACVVLALALHERGVVFPKALKRLGDYSFSLYLLHPIVIDVMANFRGRTASDVQRVLLVLLTPLIAVAIAVMWSRWIELPLYRALCAKLFGAQSRLPPADPAPQSV